MLRSSFLSILMLACLSLAQSARTPPPTPPATVSSPNQKTSASSAQTPAKPAAKKTDAPAKTTAEGGAAAAKLPANAPVITLTSFCSAGAKNKAAAKKPGCNKVITRAEFERVVHAVFPRARMANGQEVPPQVKQAIAREYATILVMANAAQNRGFPAKDPNTQEMLRLSRLQVLAQGLSQELQQEAKPSDAQIENYYKDNQSAFTEATLRRLIIPKPPASKDKPVDEAGLKAAAEKLRARAAAGEDFDKLQKETYEAAGEKQPAPPTQIGAQRRGLLPPDQDEKVFTLPAGGVSPLLENPAGWYVYKVESKRTLPLADVNEEISRKLQPQRLTDERNAIVNSVATKFNEQYFGSNEPASATGGVHLQAPPASAPPSGPKSQKPPGTSPPPSQPPQPR